MHTLICVTFSLPPGVGGWLRLLLVALPGLFYLPFWVRTLSPLQIDLFWPPCLKIIIFAPELLTILRRLLGPLGFGILSKWGYLECLFSFILLHKISYGSKLAHRIDTIDITISTSFPPVSSHFVLRKMSYCVPTFWYNSTWSLWNTERLDWYFVYAPTNEVFIHS